MAKLQLKAGTTSYIAQVFLQDSSSSTGAGLTGLTQASSGLTAYFHRDTDTTATAITLVTMTVGTFTSSGFKEIDATNMPGWYQLCPPNTALASGAKSVGIHLKGATNLAPLPLEIELTAIDNQDAVRAGLTALPNVASGSAGALLVDGTGTAAISNSSGKVLLQATQSGVTIPTVTTVTNQLTAAAIATGVWQDATSGDFTTSSSIGKSLYTTGNAPGAASGLALVGSNMGTASSVTGSVGSVTGAVGSVTGAVGSVTGAVGSVTGAVGSVASGGITRASLAADTGLQSLRSNTAQAGAATTITLDASASATNSFYNNALLVLTGGTGVGQARFITAYVGATKVATVATWGTNPDNTTTFAIMAFDAVAGASAPTAAQVATAVWQDLTASSDFTTVASIGKLLVTDIDAAISSRQATFSTPTNFSSLSINGSGQVDAIKIAGTTQTGRDLGASVLLSTGTGTGQLDFTSGVVKANLAQILGTALTETAGLLAGGFKKFFNIATPAATMDHGVLVDTVTTATTATNLTNAPTAGDLTSTMKTSVTTAASAATPVATVSGDFSATMKTSIGTAVAASAVASVTGNVSGNVTGSVGSVTGAVGSVTGNIGGNVVGSVASVTAAVAITSNIKTNQALANYEFLMTDSTNHAPATGKTVTCTRSIDGGAFGSGTLANVTEISNGMYRVDFGAGDLNGKVIVLRATATGCDDTFERLASQP